MRVSSFLRLGLLLGVIALVGLGCSPQPTVRPSKRPIIVWGLFDDAESLRPLFDAFEKQTGSKVEYTKVSPVDSYEERLKQALLEGRGPDVFLVQNSWIPRWKNALLPAPELIVPVKNVHEEFVDVVSNDFIADNRVFALPLFVDTLALYYNKDLFNNTGVAHPPYTWEEVHQIVKHVTKFNADEPGTIDVHGLTMGAGKNVNRAADILSLLMLQNGAAMLNGDGVPSFGEDDNAKQALQFYTDFANSQKEVYTWNARDHYSLDAFAEGTAAMMINYSYQMPVLRAKNPRLNVGVAKLPQVEIPSSSNPAKTYASYWGFAVARTSTVPDQAWQFVRFMTTTDVARQYASISGYPPARRDIVNELQNDARIGVFASQALSAVTWPQPDNRVVDRVFVDAIDAVVSGQDTVDGALQRAAEQIKASLPRQGTEQSS